MDSILSLHYFVQFGVSGVVICVSAFKLSLVSTELSPLSVLFNSKKQILIFFHFYFKLNPLKDHMQFIFVCEYLISMTTEVFIPCYFGSVVIQKSNRLTTKIYESNWIDKVHSFKSSLKIMLINSIEPLTPLAGGLFVIGLPTFLTVYCLSSKFKLIKILIFNIFLDFENCLLTLSVSQKFSVKNYKNQNINFYLNCNNYKVTMFSDLV